MIKRFWWILLILIALAIIWLIFSVFSKKTQITIKDKTFLVELARTDAERTKGLSWRTSLDDNQGMLFIFSESDIYSFWMKNTLIPLDIIWINDNKITEIATLNPPNDNNIPQYTPKSQANYVLEINAGLSQKYGFKIGDEVRIKY